LKNLVKSVMFSCQKIDILVKVEVSLLFDSTIKNLKKIALKAAKKTQFILEDQIAESITLNQNQDQAVKIGIQKRRHRLEENELKE